jgi:NAD(P)-dependent dehydrogenase (short-subunit alcohol dehydrogenase family)
MAVALITGTSSGIGLVTAVTLAPAGHRHCHHAQSRRGRRYEKS